MYEYTLSDPKLKFVCSWCFCSSKRQLHDIPTNSTPCHFCFPISQSFLSYCLFSSIIQLFVSLELLLPPQFWYQFLKGKGKKKAQQHRHIIQDSLGILPDIKKEKKKKIYRFPPSAQAKHLCKQTNKQTLFSPNENTKSIMKNKSKQFPAYRTLLIPQNSRK